jgi:hypothetical protein
VAYTNYITQNNRIYGFNDDGQMVDLGPNPGYDVPYAFDINAGGLIPTNAPQSPYWNAGALPMDMGAANFNPLTGQPYTQGETSYLQRAGLMGSPGSFGSRFQEMWGDSWVPWVASAMMLGAAGYGALGAGAGAAGGGSAATAGGVGGAGAVEGAAFGAAPLLADTGIAAGSEIGAGGLMAGGGAAGAGGAAAVEGAAFGGTGATSGAEATGTAGTGSLSSIGRNILTKAPGLLLSALGGSGGGGGGRTGIPSGSTLGVGGSNQIGGGEAEVKAAEMAIPTASIPAYNPYAPVATTSQAKGESYANPVMEGEAKTEKSPLLSELVERSQLGPTLWGNNQQQQSAYLQDYMRRKNAFDILSFFNALA